MADQYITLTHTAQEIDNTIDNLVQDEAAIQELQEVVGNINEVLEEVL